MSMKYLGESFDLHGGGLDLVFPHHENEIAQSESATGKPFATMWMHNGFVEVAKEKMSKSLGNFFTARELFGRLEPEAIRWAMLTVHWRAPLNLDWTIDEAGHITGFPLFEEAERRLEYLYTTRERLSTIPEDRIDDADTKVPSEVIGMDDALRQALDDDLNLPAALARVNELLRGVNELCDQAARKKGKVGRRAVEAATAGFTALDVLGVGQDAPRAFLERVRDRRAATKGVERSTVEAKIHERSEARAAKDFARADGLRDELAALGIELHDSPTGTTWSMA